MKKQYNAPAAEKIEFCYSDHVVASGQCKGYQYNKGTMGCNSEEAEVWTEGEFFQ